MLCEMSSIDSLQYSDGLYTLLFLPLKAFVLIAVGNWVGHPGKESGFR